MNNSKLSREKDIFLKNKIEFFHKQIQSSPLAITHSISTSIQMNPSTVKSNLERFMLKAPLQYNKTERIFGVLVSKESISNEFCHSLSFTPDEFLHPCSYVFRKRAESLYDRDSIKDYKGIHKNEAPDEINSKSNEINSGKISAAKKHLEEFGQYLKFMLEGFLLLDSNIWMGEKYTDLFNNLEFHLDTLKGKISVPEVQFNELVKLKDLDFENKKSKLARMALSRIERLQRRGAADIISSGKFGSNSTYADPEIVKIMESSTDSAAFSTLVTDDTELRIRVLSLKKDTIDVFSGLDFAKELHLYRKALSDAATS